jgi:membrane glycosyltransferase
LQNVSRRISHVVSAIFIKNAWPPASWRWSTASKALKASAITPTSIPGPSLRLGLLFLILSRGVLVRAFTGQVKLVGGVWLTCLMGLIKLPVYLTVRCVPRMDLCLDQVRV